MLELLVVQLLSRFFNWMKQKKKYHSNPYIQFKLVTFRISPLDGPKCTGMRLGLLSGAYYNSTVLQALS